MYKTIDKNKVSKIKEKAIACNEQNHKMNSPKKLNEYLLYPLFIDIDKSKK